MENVIRFKIKNHKEKLRLLIIIFLLFISCFLLYYFYFILDTSIVFSHFFYIPIIFASLWWKKKGLIIPILLAGLLIFFPFFVELDIMNIYNLDNFLRAIILVVSGIVVSILSEHISKVEKSLKESENRLKKFNIQLEQKIEKRTIELKESEKKTREAYNRTYFYKDLLAHDMNNILQNIQLSVELLSLSQYDSKERENISKLTNIAKTQIKRGARLISNVRQLTEIEETEIIIKSIEAYEVLKKSVENLINDFQDKKINVQIDSSSKNFYLKANELLICVFENILINTVKHNDNSPVEITIKISKYQNNNINYLKLEFIDNGRGIPDEVKKKIFLRANKTSRNGTGMGIGLSLVKKIISKYNGKIWIENKVEGDYNKGSNFILLIPEVIRKIEIAM